AHAGPVVTVVRIRQSHRVGAKRPANIAADWFDRPSRGERTHPGWWDLGVLRIALALKPRRVHSSRRRINGFTDRARCAGIHVPNSPSNAIATTTPARTTGSRGVA